MHLSWHPKAWAAHLVLGQQADGYMSSSATDWRIYRLRNSLVALNSYTGEQKVLITDETETIETIYFDAAIAITDNAICDLLARYSVAQDADSTKRT